MRSTFDRDSINKVCVRAAVAYLLAYDAQTQQTSSLQTTDDETAELLDVTVSRRRYVGDQAGRVTSLAPCQDAHRAKPSTRAVRKAFMKL